MAEKYVQINRLLELKTEDMNYVYDLCDLDEYLAGIPEKDILTITRCKDCIHWGDSTYGFVCRKFSGIDTKICMGADHFCSYGTPKERGGKK